MVQLVKNSPAVQETWIPGLGRSPGGGHGNPLQYSCLENPHGQRSLAGCSPWGCKESDVTERLRPAQHIFQDNPDIAFSKKASLYFDAPS